MSEWIHFKAPNGSVIGMTLPLHATIEQQWQRGELLQVNEDGTQWTAPDGLGDGAESSDGDGPVPEAPVRPRDSAHKREWQAHAVALGLCTEEEAGAATRAQLIELTTPPELKPPDPEV